MNVPWLGWHWLAADGRTSRHGDDAIRRRVLVEPGQTLRVQGPLELCHRGLHASARALDALDYFPGPIVTRVRLGDERLDGDDTSCSTERTALWLADATAVLHEFACRCAEHALTREREQGREPDPRSWAAIAAKRGWLRGDINDEQLFAAKADAWDAAKNAASTTAWFAAWGVTWGVAWVAARCVVNAHAGAERDRQNAEFERMLLALGPPASWSTAGQ